MATPVARVRARKAAGAQREAQKRPVPQLAPGVCRHESWGPVPSGVSRFLDGFGRSWASWCCTNPDCHTWSIEPDYPWPGYRRALITLQPIVVTAQ